MSSTIRNGLLAGVLAIGGSLLAATPARSSSRSSTAGRSSTPTAARSARRRAARGVSPTIPRGPSATRSRSRDPGPTPSNSPRTDCAAAVPAATAILQPPDPQLLLPAGPALLPMIARERPGPGVSPIPARPIPGTVLRPLASNRLVAASPFDQGREDGLTMPPRHRHRLLIMGAMALVAAFPARAGAQGFIVDRRPHVPIARSFEVREVSLDARVRDQVAEVQVSQTFHNPGSIRDRVGIPVPAPRGRGDPELRPAGRRQGAARPAPAQGRGPADLRGDRPDQARPGPARIHGPRALPDQRLPDPARGRPQGHDALHPALQARPRRRRVRLPARHPEVHRQADPAADPATSGSRAATRSSRSTARATTPTIRRAGDHEATVTLEQRDVVPTARLPAGLHPGRRGRSARPS